jgi:copper resistance protein D
MVETAIIAVRLLQYTGAAILFGLPLFFVCVLKGGLDTATARRARWLAAAGAGLLALGSMLAIGLQASLFAGSFRAGFTAEAMGQVIAFMPLGKAALVRAAAAGMALIVLLAAPSASPRWGVVAGLGAIATASLAWLGHAAAGESWLHLAADVLHALTAAAWLGALAAFGLLLAGSRTREELLRLAAALRRFSRMAVPLVAVLALTGLANTWFTVGPAGIAHLPRSAYGQLLLAKIAVFAAMLGLAGLNRNRLTPALAANPGSTSVAHLRRSIAAEALLGLVVLALVAWLGTLAPPAES